VDELDIYKLQLTPAAKEKLKTFHQEEQRIFSSVKERLRRTPKSLPDIQNELIEAGKRYAKRSLRNLTLCFLESGISEGAAVRDLQSYGRELLTEIHDALLNPTLVELDLPRFKSCLDTHIDQTIDKEIAEIVGVPREISLELECAIADAERELYTSLDQFWRGQPSVESVLSEKNHRDLFPQFETLASAIVRARWNALLSLGYSSTDVLITTARFVIPGTIELVVPPLTFSNEMLSRMDLRNSSIDLTPYGYWEQSLRKSWDFHKSRESILSEDEHDWSIHYMLALRFPENRDFLIDRLFKYLSMDVARLKPEGFRHDLSKLVKQPVSQAALPSVLVAAAKGNAGSVHPAVQSEPGFDETVRRNLIARLSPEGILGLDGQWLPEIIAGSKSSFSLVADKSFREWIENANPNSKETLLDGLSELLDQLFTLAELSIANLFELSLERHGLPSADDVAVAFQETYRLSALEPPVATVNQAIRRVRVSADLSPESKRWRVREVYLLLTTLAAVDSKWKSWLDDVRERSKVLDLDRPLFTIIGKDSVESFILKRYDDCILDRLVAAIETTVEKGRTRDTPEPTSHSEDSGKDVNPAALPGSSERLVIREDTPRFVFQQEDEFWILTFEGQTKRIRSQKGFEYIVELLRAPNKEMEALVLSGARSQSETPKLIERGLETADAKAVQVVHAELQSIRNQLSILDSNDWTRNGDLEEKAEKLQQYLRQNQGRTKTTRSAKSSNEKARTSVTNAVRRSIQKIRESLPEMADHLEASVSTGYLLMYRAQSEIDWTF
jgi:hypothetical protein